VWEKIASSFRIRIAISILEPATISVRNILHHISLRRDIKGAACSYCDSSHIAARFVSCRHNYLNQVAGSETLHPALLFGTRAKTRRAARWTGHAQVPITFVTIGVSCKTKAGQSGAQAHPLFQGIWVTDTTATSCSSQREAYQAIKTPQLKFLDFLTDIAFTVPSITGRNNRYSYAEK